ncbi:MAG: rhomboid family intramembrane serine protease [Candidatus Aminicenantia bacterium]
MIIPIGHETDTVRRIPWITFIIMGLCVIIHLFISSAIKKSEIEFNNIAKELFEYYFEHPYLELDPEVEKLFFISEEHKKAIKETLSLYHRQLPDKNTIVKEQEKLDQMAQELKDIFNKNPYNQWGFIPAKQTFPGSLTYMFIHVGWLHLIGNLLFLYLTGPFIEDVWGKPIYTVFYFVMGMLSAQMFALHYPNFSGPLVGASGAISGVMGAFLIRYWKTKIRFFFILVGRTFAAPAWLMLPLWLFYEILNAKLMDAINPQGGGVAYWSHVWGFIFGVIVAIVIKITRIEESINKKIEAQTSYVDKGYKTSQEAMALVLNGRKDAAYQMLLDAARENPTHQEVGEALWNLSVEMGKENETVTFFTKMIENLIKRNQLNSALFYYRQLKTKIPDASIDTYAKIILIEYLIEKKEFKEAEELTREILNEIDLNSPPGLLLYFSSTVLKLDRSLAEKVIAVSLSHPEIPEDKKAELKAKLSETS